jgi:hypothetical protein
VSHSLCDLFELFGRLAAFRHHQAHNASELQIIHLHVAIYAYFHRYFLSVLRIRDVYPKSCFLIIPVPDPGSRIQKQQQERGMEKLVVIPFFCSYKFHKIENYFIYEMLKKKMWANFQRIIELFTQNIVTKLSKICVWDPRSGIQGFKRQRIPDPDQLYCFR